MKSDDRILELPQPIIDRLREVIQRIRRLQWIKGSLLTFAAAVSAVLGVMAVDAAFSLESVTLRLALSFSALAATAWVAWSYWLRPLCRRISLTAVARWVESRHPELQERISTAVELLGERHAADDQGSRQLLEAVVQDAVADVGKMDPAQDLSPRRTRPAKWLAGTAVAALLIITTIWPGKIPRLLARAVAPMADTGNAWADRLRVITQSQVMAMGDPLAIEVAHAGRPERVELHLTTPDGRTVVEMLQPDPAVATEEGETGYALRLPSVTQTFTAKVTAGKAVSAAFTITAVPRPEPGPWTLTFDYPDYTGLPDEIKTGASGEITALTGTRVSARSALNRAVAQAGITIAGAAIPDVRIDPAPAGPAVEWSTVLTPNLDAFWSLQLEDAHGIGNRPVDLPIRSVADLPPVITLETPAEDRMELRPTEKLSLTYSVKEDVGLSAVQIRIRPQDQPEYLLPPQSLPDKSSDSPDEYRGTAVLDLAKVLVPEGREIRVCLMAADRVPADLQGPQRGYSREIVIRLNRWTRPLVEQNFAAQHEELKKKMEQIKNELSSAKNRFNDKPDRLKHEEKLSENTLKDIETGTDHLQQAETLLQELAQRMKDTAYARQTPAMEEIAQQLVDPAKTSAQEIPLTDQKEARADLAKNTKDLLESALKKMEQQQQQMEQSREAVQQVAKLSDVAEQQQRLATEAAEAAAASPPSGTPPEAAQANPTPPSNPADPATPAAASQQAANAQTPPSAPVPEAPTNEEQRQWLEEQRRVAQRARELMEQNKNSNPQATQEQMKQAAAQAAQLAAEAGALAQKESQLAGELPAATTPQAKADAAAAQQELASQTAALKEKASRFQEQSSPQINQSSETQEAAFQAQSQLEEATGQAKQAGEALTTAAKADAAKAAKAAAAAAAAQASPPDTSPPAADKAGQPAITANSPAPDGPPGAEKTAGPPAAQPSGSSPDGSAPPADSPTPSTAGAASGAPATTPGQPAAQASSAALAEAASSLQSLGEELNSLAGTMADHSNSLNQGAQQAGTAADQAAQSQNEPGKGPSMQQGAQSAQQAADQLATAANTAMQSMSIPASAKASQSSTASKGQGKPQDGQPNPSQPGQEGKEGLQMDTASSLLPAELARLGLTQDDWMKLKSTLNGVDGAAGGQVPAEYRDLVKAYFGALAKGNPAK